MNEDLKSFNQRKRKSLQINKNNKKKCSYHDLKSLQKVNKIIRVHTRCSLSVALENGTVCDFLLPNHTNKYSLAYWDLKYKIKIY